MSYIYDCGCLLGHVDSPVELWENHYLSSNGCFGGLLTSQLTPPAIPICVEPQDDEKWSVLLGISACFCYALHDNVLQTHTFGDIMKTEMLSTRIDHDTKLAFTNVCEGMGLSPSQAIKLFAKAVVNYGGIPFELKVKQPNAATASAISELESGKANTASNIEELFEELKVGKIDNA